MGSGLIYLIIVGMWISYFLPQWVSNHEEESGKSVVKFQDSMRAVAHSAGVQTDDELARKSAHNLAIRRTYFSSLALLLFLVGSLAIIGILSPIVILLPISGLILYVAQVRRKIRVTNREFRKQNMLNTTSSNNSNNFQRVNTHLANDSTRNQIKDRLLSSSESSLENWIPLAERIERVEQELSGITLLPKGSAKQGWTPQEIPSPTYVSAPKAISARRIIDLTVPGVWLDEQNRIKDELLAVSEPSEQLYDQELAEKDNTRVVNE